MVFSHDRIWRAIDALAARNGLSPSGLARQAGLSPTALNLSKRIAGGGRPRWPSTESVAKILEATDTSLEDLLHLMREPDAAPAGPPPAEWPVGFAEDGSADDAHRWRITVPSPGFPPLYRAGDQLLVTAVEAVRPGDRIVVGRRGDALVIGEVAAAGPELTLAIPGRSGETVVAGDGIVFLARILWASQ